MQKRSIAIDMDHVIADVESQFISWYERDYGIRIAKEALIGRPEGEAFPDKEAVRRFCFTPGFFSSLPVIPGSREIIRSLMEDYDVYIVSAAMEFPQSLYEKRQWLDEHFPFISWRNIILCGDKSVIGTDYLIDDHCKNLDFFRGKPIIFTASHNTNITHHFRVKDWEEAAVFFKTELVHNNSGSKY